MRCLLVRFAWTYSHKPNVQTSALICTSLQAKSSPTFKDIDFTQECGKIQIDPTTREEFIRKVEKDVGVSALLSGVCVCVGCTLEPVC